MTRLVMAASEKTITDILGSPDDMKFRSCMTLFDAVSKREIFAEAAATFYPYGRTLRIGYPENVPFVERHLESRELRRRPIVLSGRLEEPLEICRCRTP